MPMSLASGTASSSHPRIIWATSLRDRPIRLGARDVSRWRNRPSASERASAAFRPTTSAPASRCGSHRLRAAAEPARGLRPKLRPCSQQAGRKIGAQRRRSARVAERLEQPHVRSAVRRDQLKAVDRLGRVRAIVREVAALEDDVRADRPLSLPDARRTAGRRQIAGASDRRPSRIVRMRDRDLVGIGANNERIPSLSRALDFLQVVPIEIPVNADVAAQIPSRKHHQTSAIPAAITELFNRR